METTEIVNTEKGETIAEIVTHDIRTAQVFRKYGIDFCCGGKRTVSKVCQDKNIDEQNLRSDLEQVSREKQDNRNDASQWKLGFLADYIVNVHHDYVKNTIPALSAWAEKVARVHGESSPQVVPIHKLFADVAEELTMHMLKEERVLFPYVKLLEEAAENHQPVSRAHFGSVRNPIHMMEMEHETVGELIQEIQNLSNNYTPPPEACNTFRALYNTLKEFEDDLFLHIHLENNILFPKAVALEKQLAE